MGTLDALTTLCVAPPLTHRAWTRAPSPGCELSVALGWGCRWLSDNMLTGPMPSEMGSMDALEYLCVLRRQIQHDVTLGESGMSSCSGTLVAVIFVAHRVRGVRGCAREGSVSQRATTDGGWVWRCRHLNNNMGLTGAAVTLSTGSEYSTSCTGLTGMDFSDSETESDCSAASVRASLTLLEVEGR
jgi:hypothetical protein